MISKFNVYKEIESIINKTLNVGTISEELRCCEKSDSPKTARNLLIKNNFDVIGVRDNGKLVGYTSLSYDA